MGHVFRDSWGGFPSLGLVIPRVGLAFCDRVLLLRAAEACACLQVPQ